MRRDGLLHVCILVVKGLRAMTGVVAEKPRRREKRMEGIVFIVLL